MTEIILHISSGKGPAECCWVVAKLAQAFTREGAEQGITCDVLDAGEALPASLFLSVSGEAAPAFVRERIGTIQWVGDSPFRPLHKRRNWFVGVSLAPPHLSRSALRAPLVRAVLRWPRYISAGAHPRQAGRSKKIKVHLVVLVDSRKKDPPSRASPAGSASPHRRAHLLAHRLRQTPLKTCGGEGRMSRLRDGALRKKVAPPPTFAFAALRRRSVPLPMKWGGIRKSRRRPWRATAFQVEGGGP